MLFPVEYRALRVDRMPWLCFGGMALWILTGVAMVFGWPGAGSVPGLHVDAITPVAVAGHWLWHESWAHGLATLTLLLFVGPALEEAWGRLLLAGVALLGLALTSGVQLFAMGETPRLLVGPSGLVALLLAAAIVRFRREGLHYTAVGWWQGIVHTKFWIPSYALILGWFVFEVLMQGAGDISGPTRGISYAGPIAGAILGTGLGYALQAYGLEERLRPARADSPQVALEMAQLALDGNEPDAALAALDTALAVHPNDDTLVTRFCSIAAETGATDRGRARFETRVLEAAKAGDVDAAAALWRRFAPQLGRVDLPQRSQLAIAASLGSTTPDEAARLLKRALEAPKPTMGLALRIADLARSVHAGVAADAARLALELGGDELPAPKRNKLEALAEEMEAQRAALPEVDLSDPVEIASAAETIQVDDPSERTLDAEGGSLELGNAAAPDVDRGLDPGFEEEDLSKPPAGFESQADTKPEDVWELDAEEAQPESPAAPLALSLDGSLGESEDEPLASTDYLEPPNAVDESDTNADDVPTTLPLLGAPPAGDAPPPPSVARVLPPTDSLGTDENPAAEVESESDLEDVSDSDLELVSIEDHDSLDLDVGPEVAARLPRFSNVKRIEVTPTELQETRLAVRQATETPAWFSLAKVEALSAAAVEGLAARPVLLIDLLVHWNDTSEDATLRVVRLRSDRFTPSHLLPDAAEGLDGFRDVLAALLARTSATPLPDANAARGNPFARFADLASYEREVLQLDV